MKKFAIYLVIAIIIVAALTYALGEQGLLGGILGALGIGANKGLQELKKRGEELDKQADTIKNELKEIEKEKNKPTEDLSPEEEEEYWKNQ